MDSHTHGGAQHASVLPGLGPGNAEVNWMLPGLEGQASVGTFVLI